MKQREDSIKIIQQKYKKYKQLKLLKNLREKNKNYYFIYPSIGNYSSIKIKIFTDLRNSTKYKILLVKFCPIRNCFVFEIPKSKFLKKKKIMRFNFIIDNKIIIDPSFDFVLFGDSYVNQIDFKVYDDKVLKSEKKYDYVIKNKNESKNQKNGIKNSKKYNKGKFVTLENEQSSINDYDEDFACIDLPMPKFKNTVSQMYKMNINIKKTEKSSKKTNEIFSITTDESTRTLQNMNLSENEGFDSKRKYPKRIKRIKTCSILKDRNDVKKENFLSKSTDAINKRVSFGVVQYSY